MIDPLFLLLVTLTALDLAFVHATDVVAHAQLMPLWALALAAPWLRRLQRFALYRRAWNGAVLLVFALLVHHATTTGLLHMLEDGLVLAVLCQVHLLNNVGDRQRPDLIFFNSFLIAFVTSFFAPDVAWSLLFVVHAFVLVPGLQLHALLRRRPALDGDVVRLVLRGSVPRTIAIGIATAAVFVVCPRDFRRDGWLDETAGLHDPFQSGLADRIRIDDERTMRLGDEVVAHLQPASQRAGDVPSHWRTNVFSAFDGGAWSPQNATVLGSRFASDPPWDRRADGSWYRQGAPRAAATTVHVRLDELSGRRLPCPIAAVRMTVLDDADLVVDAKAFGGFTVLSRAGGRLRAVSYDVDVAAEAGATNVSPPTRQHFTTLPDRVPAALYALAEQLRGTLPPTHGELEAARVAAEWLQDNRRYQLPGGPGFARNLGEFLLGSGAGHCEYFATAMALLLRTLDVPCRIAGGYLAHEWNADVGAVVVREKHAHAWVEVLDADGRWHTFDPTPAGDVAGEASGTPTWWSDVRAALSSWWSHVAGFDAEAQRRWLAGLRSLPAEHPVALAGALAIAAAVVYLRRRRRQAEPTIQALERAMRAARLSLRCGETPRELLARAAAADLEPRLLARLTTATHRHEASRYRTSLCARRT